MEGEGVERGRIYAPVTLSVCACAHALNIKVV